MHTRRDADKLFHIQDFCALCPEMNFYIIFLSINLFSNYQCLSNAISAAL